MNDAVHAINLRDPPGVHAHHRLERPVCGETKDATSHILVDLLAWPPSPSGAQMARSTHTRRCTMLARVAIGMSCESCWIFKRGATSPRRTRRAGGASIGLPTTATPCSCPPSSIIRSTRGPPAFPVRRRCTSTSNGRILCNDS